MNKDRYHELMTNTSLQLTENEINEGYHFCYDWDGLLIHKNDEKFKFCICGDYCN